jgi:glucosamine-6-phosphate deaminase
MEVIVKPDYLEMSIAAARMIAAEIQARPTLTLCLSAGNTPTGAYRELLRIYQSGGLKLSGVTFFFLDEYDGLAEGHPESFRSYLDREVFKPAHIPVANIHAPDLNYEETIRNAGGIDLLICGIGANGHIAFNEPGSPMDSRTRFVSLADSTMRGLRSKFTPEESPRRAITMGLATILESRKILLLANGKEKASILARAIRGPVTTDVPASVLQSHPNVTVITDQTFGDS